MVNENGSPPPRIAIVGAGPAGCYTAQFLRKRWPKAHITVFDRQDHPHGLIRYGVAPDHLGTKAIAKQFDRLFERDGVHFVGGTDVGTVITLDQLRADYDAVVLATGLWADREIERFHSNDGAPGLAGVYGAGYLTRLINGHPGETADQLKIGTRTVVVGNGNVAADLVRLLLTPAHDLRKHGVKAEVVAALGVDSIERIDVVGRSPAYLSKFDAAMIRELAKSPDVRFTSDALATDSIDGSMPNALAIRDLVEGSVTPASRLVAFHFGWLPDHLEGDERVQRAIFRSVGEHAANLEIETDSICTAVGFTETAGAALQRDSIASPTADLDHGRLDEGLYCVGWFRRGPVGTIPANRADARTVADAIITDVEAASAPRDPLTTTLIKELR